MTTMTWAQVGRLQEALQEQLGPWTGCLQEGGSRGEPAQAWAAEAVQVLLQQLQQVQLRAAAAALLHGAATQLLLLQLQTLA